MQATAAHIALLLLLVLAACTARPAAAGRTLQQQGGAAAPQVQIVNGTLVPVAPTPTPAEPAQPAAQPGAPPPVVAPAAGRPVATLAPLPAPVPEEPEAGINNDGEPLHSVGLARLPEGMADVVG